LFLHQTKFCPTLSEKRATNLVGCYRFWVTLEQESPNLFGSPVQKDNGP